MKRVRILLRVSSNQQLESDGDLGIQRQLVMEYIERHPDWKLDEKEYFEGSNSGYKNSVADRDVLQEAHKDAERKEYDILVAYKDDRIGRRMWEIGGYVMSLKGLGVDIYTVKDGCISPESDDVMGQMVLAIRYANAQKSSADTGLRVKDTAQKLVQKGRFLGGKAPFGYELKHSGEISKHGRAIHHLVIIPEQAEVVQYIYNLSFNKEYGSAKIALTLNQDERYKYLAPHDDWKGGTITSILTNPIYAGHTAYKRRERVDGKYRKLDSKDWILSFEANENITIISSELWNKVQDKRKRRGVKYMKKLENQDVTIIKRNDGVLPLVDVLHCGYCGCKMVNGSKYNYWTIKGTGEKRTSKIPIYKCQNAWQGVPHNKVKQFRADFIEPIIFDAIAKYIGTLQENEDVYEQIQLNQNKAKKAKAKILSEEKQNLDKLKVELATMESYIPEAMTGNYTFTLDELVGYIKQQKEKIQSQDTIVAEKETELKELTITINDWEDVKSKIPTWQDIFLNADSATKRVLVNKLIERIDVKKDQVIVRFKVNLNNFFHQPRISDGFGVSQSRI